MPVQQVWNLMQSSDTARPNLLTNGGLEIWQRGTSFSGVFPWTADRWRSQVAAGAGTLLTTRETTEVDTGSEASAKLVYTPGAGDATISLYQELNDLRFSARGRTMSLSMRVKCSVIGRVRLWWYDAITGGATRQYASSYNTTTGWETLAWTFTVASNATGLLMGLEITPGTAVTMYVDNSMLVMGSVPANYTPLHPADDLARCLRYYEVHGGWTGNTMIHNTYGLASQTIQWPHHFAVRKAVTPTLTKVGTWAGANTGQPVGGDADVMMYNFAFMVTAQGAAQVYSPGGSGAAIIAEANP